MRDFTKLQVWHKGHALVLDVYRSSKGFPAEERFGLTQQVRKSAASVPANIAEGAGRRTRADFARFVDIASGSANETAYHLMLAKDLGYLDSDTFERLESRNRELRKMLTSFAQTLRSTTS